MEDAKNTQTDAKDQDGSLASSHSSIASIISILFSKALIEEWKFLHDKRIHDSL